MGLQPSLRPAQARAVGEVSQGKYCLSEFWLVLTFVLSSGDQDPAQALAEGMQLSGYRTEMVLVKL